MTDNTEEPFVTFGRRWDGAFWACGLCGWVGVGLAGGEPAARREHAQHMKEHHPTEAAARAIHEVEFGAYMPGAGYDHNRQTWPFLSGRARGTWMNYAAAAYPVIAARVRVEVEAECAAEYDDLNANYHTACGSIARLQKQLATVRAETRAEVAEEIAAAMEAKFGPVVSLIAVAAAVRSFASVSSPPEGRQQA